MSSARRIGAARKAVWFVLCVCLTQTDIVTVRGVSDTVVISQVYGGGGNSGAPFQNKFVELFNRGTTAVSLNGWSLQYASATGTGYFSVNSPFSFPANASIAPGQHYLVQVGPTGTCGGTGTCAPLPTTDAIATSLNPAAGAGKLIVARTTTGLSCNGSLGQPCTAEQLAQIVDLVGYGNANFFEGAAAVPTLSNTVAGFRNSGGCIDTDNNGADFTTAAPNPRNTTAALSPCVIDVPPVITSTVPSSGVGAVALDANVTVTFSEPVAVASGAFQISCTMSGSHSLAVSGGPMTFTLNPATDFVSSEICTLTVQGAAVTDLDGAPQAMVADARISFSTIEICGDPATPIHAIQGNGLVSPLAGASNAIEGVVIGSFQGTGQFGGFYVQEEDADADADPLTSEGLFVFSTSALVNVGDKVRVRGTVFEFVSSGTPLTELTSVTGLRVCSSGNALPTASTVTLPVSAVNVWEQYEGMLISIPQLLTVSETFTLARFGELALSANGRLLQPTNVVAPGAPAAGRQDLNDRSRIVLDDGNNQQNIDPTRYPAGGLSAANTLRSGDTVNGLTGVLDQRFGVYRVQPTGSILVNAANPRPATLAAVGGSLKVASFNVLNFFNGNGTHEEAAAGGFPTSRGATSQFEFERQLAKEVSALTTMGADIVGLMELENDAPGNSAIEDLVDGLNAATAPGTYAFIDTGVVGTDEIRVGLLYKPAIVTPFNSFAILDSTVDPNFIDTLNRPSLAQTFTQVLNGKRLTVVVNHLKSKGSDCDAVSDPDTGDGQGNCNITRTKAAAALVQWLAGDPTGAGDPDVLVIGDMNSYAMENPITTIASAGYTDLVGTRVGAGAYSYVFDGQSGYLDHALASNVLAPRVTGVTEWHINADEPIALDYNVEFKTPNQVNTFYAANPFRSSDHDPVVVGINLIEPFSWSGFFSPVGQWNSVKAGRAVPLKFSLGGNRGLDIFSAGSPSSAQASCEGTVSGPYEPTVTPGGSSLTYDASSDSYTYVWRTQQEWSGTCRKLVVALADGTSHSVMFAFTK